MIAVVVLPIIEYFNGAFFPSFFFKDQAQRPLNLCDSEMPRLLGGPRWALLEATALV